MEKGLERRMKPRIDLLMGNFNIVTDKKEIENYIEENRERATGSPLYQLGC